MRKLIKKKVKKDPYQWHNWFAWHPVKVTKDDNTYLVWFEIVERKLVTSWKGVGCVYKLPPDPPLFY